MSSSKSSDLRSSAGPFDKSKTGSGRTEANSAPDDVPADHVIVGRVQGAWGRHGEMKLQLHTNFPDRFASGATVFLQGAPTIVQRSRPYKSGLLVKLWCVNGRSAAARLRDAYLSVPSADLPELEDSTYYHFEIVGLEVWNAEGERLGRVREILETGSNDVYVVQRESERDLLVPAIADVVLDVDVNAGRMTVELLEGLA